MTTPALALPEPLPDDPEVVATAIETAGIFGVQGDMREAVRWLRRAAELAGDAGIDDRALALARAAADLSTQATEAASAAPPAPAASAPPASPTPPPLPTAEEAPPTVASSPPPLVAAPPPPPPPPPPPKPIQAGQRPSSRLSEAPPKPSVSVSPIVPLNGGADAPAPFVSEADGANVTSSGAATSAESTPTNGSSARAVNAPAAVTPPLDAAALANATPPRVVPSNGASSSRDTTPFGGRSSLDRTLEMLPPARNDKTGELAPPTQMVSEQLPQETVRYPTGIDPAAALAASEPGDETGALLRQSRRRAVRASIEASQDAGVYIVRLLKNGEDVGSGAHEAMVVLVDPRAELFVAP